jgi:hypothetical protein
VVLGILERFGNPFHLISVFDFIYITIECVLAINHQQIGMKKILTDLGWFLSRD